jgi:hypothetical protein
MPTGGGKPLGETLAMKTMILAAFAALSLQTAIASVAQARSTVADDATATLRQQTGSYSQ